MTIIATSCKTQDKPADFDYGRVENNHYVNHFFECEITLPEDWVIQTKEQVENLSKTGKDLIAGDDANMKAVVKASEVNVANLLAVYQFEVGSSVEYNPSIMLIAENVKNSPGIKNGSDYLFQARKMLGQSQIKYDHLDEQFAKEAINGTDFYKMNAEIHLRDLDIKQIYYSTVLKRFTFNMIISFINDQQKQDLLKAINSTKFKN